LECTNHARNKRDSIYLVNCEIWNADDWNVVRTLEHYVVGNITVTETTLPWQVKAATPEEFEHALVSKVCTGITEYLEVEWDDASCAEVFDDYFTAASRDHSLDELTRRLRDSNVQLRAFLSRARYDQILDQIVECVRYAASQYFHDVDDTAIRAHAEAHVPAFDATQNEPRFRVLFEPSEYRAMLQLNPALRETPPDLSTLLHPALSPSPELSPQGQAMESLFRLASIWDTDGDSIRAHHSLFVDALKVLNMNIARFAPAIAVEALHQDPAMSGSVLRTIAACIEILGDDRAILKYPPDLEYIHWSHFQRDLPWNVRDAVASDLPSRDESCIRWSWRSYAAMHYIALGIAALKRTTWQGVDAHRLVDALVQALGHLKIARKSIDTIAGILLDRAMYLEAYVLVTARYGTVPERFRGLRDAVTSVSSSGSGCS
jgi:hypothetical protein